MRISYFWSSWEQDQSCHQWPKQRFTSSQGRVAAGAAQEPRAGWRRQLRELRLLLVIFPWHFCPFLLPQGRLASPSELGCSSTALQPLLGPACTSAPLLVSPLSQKDFCPQLESSAEQGSALWAVFAPHRHA